MNINQADNITLWAESITKESQSKSMVVFEETPWHKKKHAKDVPSVLLNFLIVWLNYLYIVAAPKCHNHSQYFWNQ